MSRASSRLCGAASVLVVMTWSSALWAQQVTPEAPGDESLIEDPEEESSVDGVVETRSVRRLSASDASADTQVVTREELQRQGTSSLMDAIAQVAPWLYVPTDGSGASGIGRGSPQGVSGRGISPRGGSRVLTVWDGMPDLNTTVGQLTTDFYVDALLDRVEIASGGDSVRWGSNAMLGVILLRSRWREKPGWSTQLDVGAGQGDQYRVQAATLGRQKRWQISGAATARQSTGALAYTLSNVYTAQAAVRRQVARGASFTARLRYGLLDGERGGTTQMLEPGRFYLSERGVAQLDYTHELGQGLTARVQGLASMTSDRIHDGFRLQDRTLTIRSMLLARPHEKAWMRAGFEIESVTADAAQDYLGFEFDVEPEVVTAPFVEGSWRVTEDVSLVAGTRLLYGAQGEAGEFGEVLYKVGASWWAWRGGQWRARLSKNYRRATPAERYVMRESNEALKPEFARTAEVGFSQYVGQKLDLTLTAYQLDSDDLIIGDGTPPDIILVNAGEARSRGLEARAMWRPAGWVGLGGSATRFVQRIEREVGNAPPVSASGNIMVRPSQETLVQVNGLYVAPRQVLGRNAGEIGARVNVNLFASWRPTQRVELYGQVTNALDRTDEFLPGNPSAPRRAFVGCRVDMGE